jgi:hypothetical protein
VIEWVKQKIHESETEPQTSLNSCTVTMDDFRVYKQEKSLAFWIIMFVLYSIKIGCVKECSTIK